MVAIVAMIAIVVVVMKGIVMVVKGVVMVVKGAVRMNFWTRVVPTIERFDFKVLRGLFLFPKLFFETFYGQKLFQEFLRNGQCWGCNSFRVEKNFSIYKTSRIVFIEQNMYVRCMDIIIVL